MAFRRFVWFLASCVAIAAVACSSRERPAFEVFVGRADAGVAPLGMFGRGDLVYVLASVRDEAPSHVIRHAGRLLAFDVGDPAHPTTVAAIDLLGEIVGSHRVGDVLYVVTYEDGACVLCGPERRTTVTSFDVHDVPKLADVLRFEGASETFAGARRAVTFSGARMYVGGLRWDSTGAGEPRSVVEVVDLSSPSGTFAKGAVIAIEGVVRERWQMNEHEGVLRVVSRYVADGSGSPVRSPKVQTLRVNAANDLVPLASAEIVLPEPDDLQGILFDGPRAYLRTTAALHPLDLSDPAAPQAKAPLALPDLVMHAEPKGNRLLSLSLDRSGTGSLTLSLFDVGDLAQPKRLQRVQLAAGVLAGEVAYGYGRWRFQSLADAGLLVVPFEVGASGGSYATSLQLLELASDALTLRGVVPQRGLQRRALVRDGRLFALAGDLVSVSDVTQPASPVHLAAEALGRRSYLDARVGDTEVVLTEDAWSRRPRIVTYAEGSTVPDGVLDLPPRGDENSGGAPLFTTRLLPMDGARVALITSARPFSYDRENAPASRVVVATVVDVSSPAQPHLVGRVELPALPGGHGYWDSEDLGEPVLAERASLAVLGTRVVYTQGWYDAPATMYDGPNPPVLSRRVSIVELSGRAGPELVAALDLPPALGATGLVVDGGLVRTTRWERVNERPGRVRFTLETLDPSTGRVVEERPVPGSLLGAEGGRVVVAGYTRTETPVPSTECRTERSSTVTVAYMATTETCVRVEATVQLVALEPQHTRIVGPAPAP